MSLWERLFLSSKLLSIGNVRLVETESVTQASPNQTSFTATYKNVLGTGIFTQHWLIRKN